MLNQVAQTRDNDSGDPRQGRPLTRTQNLKTRADPGGPRQSLARPGGLIEATQCKARATGSTQETVLQVTQDKALRLAPGSGLTVTDSGDPRQGYDRRLLTRAPASRTLLPESAGTPVRLARHGGRSRPELTQATDGDPRTRDKARLG